MAAKKARKSKKVPSAKQLAARRKFALAAKARSKAAKAKAAKRPAHKAAKKRNSKTIIKAKRVTILNLSKKKNPPRKANITSASDLQYAGTAKKVTQDGVKGWMLGSKFFPGSATTKAQKITSSAYLDLRTGDVWKRKAKGNPKQNEPKRGQQVYTLASFKPMPGMVVVYVGKEGSKYLLSTGAKTAKASRKDFRLSFAEAAGNVLAKRKKNIAGFIQDGVFHPIRSGIEQRTTKSGVRRVKSKKAYKPSKVGEARTYSAKKSAKRAAQSKRMAAATKQRKTTTTRLASRLLDRSGPARKARRNPDTPAQKLQEWRGYPKDRDDNLRFPNGTPSGLYKLGALKKIVTTHNTINFASNQAWLCADTKGKLYVGGIAKSAAKGRMTNLPAGSLGKVTRVEYLEKKPHLKDYDKTLYFHKMGEEDGNKPTLYSDGDGNLLFKGGNYQVTYRGIVN